MITLAFALATAPIVPLPAEPISLSTTAWGRPILEWRIDTDGAIVITAMTPVDPDNGGAYKIVTKRTPPDARRYSLIASILNAARSRAGSELRCRNPITDADAGTVRWGEVDKLDFYTGCKERDTRAVLDGLDRATRFIRDWTWAAPVVETKDGNWSSRQ